MQKRRLGAGGPEVSAIGVGAMSFAGVYGRSTEAEAHALLAAALDLGIDHIDTSNVYGMGRSESMIGSFLPGRARRRFRIATKAAIRQRPGAERRWFDNSAAHLAAELDGSLRRLGVETVDLFYVHRRDPEVPIEAVADALAGLVARRQDPRDRLLRDRALLAPAGGGGASGGGGAVGILARDPRGRSSGWCRPAPRSAPRSSPSRRWGARC